MLLANEHVAAFLAGRNRQALYRVHERPEPQSVSLLLAKLTELGVPTPPVPDVLTSQAAAELAGEISRRVAEYVEQSGRGREAFPRSCCARSSGRATTRGTSATRASRARRTATSPRRSGATPTSSSTVRCCASSAWATTRCRTSWRSSPSTRRRASARRRRLEYLADEICLAWLLDDRLRERGWDEPWEGEIIGLIGAGPVRALRRGLRGLPAGAAAAGRVLRAEPDGDGAGRPPVGPDVPARRPDRGARRVGREGARARSS